jgi:ATP-dependent DNA helicase RecG
MTYPLFHPSSHRPIPLVLTRQDFREEFPGEDGHIEFKESVSNGDRIQDAVVAFSNSDGGVLIVGVDKAGRVIGIRDTGEIERQVHQIVRNTNNPGRYEVHTLGVEEAKVLVLAVARRQEGFSQTSSGVVKVRNGASNNALIGEHLNRLVQARAFTHFEDTPAKVALSAASPRLLERLRQLHGWPTDDLENRLIESKYAIRDRAATTLTISGGLFLLENPSDLGIRAQVEVLRFPRNSDDPDKRTTITGPIDEQVERTTAAILNELGETSVLVGTRRVDTPKLPPTAIREAIANAIAHRSYEASGTAVRVEIREDSVKIISPGPLLEPVTLQNLRNQQAARNQTVLSTLHRMGLAEDLGRGIDRIEDEMAAQLLHRPEFADDGAFVAVTLRTSGLVTPLERAWLGRLIESKHLDANDLLILVLAVRDGAITNADVRSALNLDSVAARATLQRLRDQGLLMQEGTRGGATYRPAEHLGVPAGVRLDRSALETQAVALATDGPISNTDVREAFGLDRIQAGYVLQALVQSGRLIKTGSKRGTRYGIPPE